MIVSGGKNMHDALIYTMVLNDYQINVLWCLHGPSMPEKKKTSTFLKTQGPKYHRQHVCTLLWLKLSIYQNDVYMLYSYWMSCKHANQHIPNKDNNIIFLLFSCGVHNHSV